MFKPRIALLGILALLVASGIAVPAASAGQGPYWHVGGKKLGQGKIKQVKFQLKFNKEFGLSGEIAGFASEIICHNIYSEGASIEGQGPFQGQDKGRVVFEQCENAHKTIRRMQANRTHQNQPIEIVSGV